MLDPKDRHAVERAMRQLHDLGFAVDEVSVSLDGESQKLYFQPKLVAPGYHRNRLRELTGLETEALQAKRLLASLDRFRGREESPKHDFVAVEAKCESLILADVDHFKRINDTWGHPAGDQVLQRVAAVLRTGVRATDSVVRWGGEEFLLVLPYCEQAGVLSRNRRKFRQPINVACPAPGRWGRPNSRVTSRHFDHGNASRTSRPDCSGLDEAD